MENKPKKAIIIKIGSAWNENDGAELEVQRKLCNTLTVGEPMKFGIMLAENHVYDMVGIHNDCQEKFTNFYYTDEEDDMGRPIKVDDSILSKDYSKCDIKAYLGVYDIDLIIWQGNNTAEGRVSELIERQYKFIKDLQDTKILNRQFFIMTDNKLPLLRPEGFPELDSTQIEVVAQMQHVDKYEEDLKEFNKLENILRYRSVLSPLFKCYPHLSKKEVEKLSGKPMFYDDFKSWTYTPLESMIYYGRKPLEYMPKDENKFVLPFNYLEYTSQELLSKYLCTTLPTYQKMDIEWVGNFTEGGKKALSKVIEKSEAYSMPRKMIPKRLRWETFHKEVGERYTHMILSTTVIYGYYGLVPNKFIEVFMSGLVPCLLGSEWEILITHNKKHSHVLKYMSEFKMWQWNDIDYTNVEFHKDYNFLQKIVFSGCVGGIKEICSIFA